MLISHKHKFITIDVPKTATRSLRETLLPQSVIDIVGEPNLNADFYQHGTAQQCFNSFQKLNKNFSEYFSFTIVRNPWDRYYSFFKYLKHKSELYSNSKLMGDYLSSKSHVWQHSGLYQNWINQEINYCRQAFDLLSSSGNDQTALKNIILENNSQDSYYCDKNGEIMVSHIAKFENLNKEFELLCNKVNVNYSPLFHGNKSTIKSSYHDAYTQDTIDLVAKKEGVVIKLKNYGYISQT